MPSVQIDHRSVSGVLLAAMTALCGLTLSSSPPLLQVSEMGAVEDGTPLQVCGIVADIRDFESGYTSVLLADYLSGDTVSIMIGPDSVRATAVDFSIGDEILVEGIVFTGPPRTTIFSDSEDARILSKAEFAMSLEFLCANWRLFEFDRFNVSGVIIAEPDADSLSLADSLSEYRIRIRLGSSSVAVIPGDEAVLDCTLLLDVQTMSLFLHVWSSRAPAT
ncbi:MAG: hypothetical protein JSV94_04855 [Methanobacteriota archaeon]|nr:MAG: hypothetical protein JSV94_04855 [Euryarchaeota archaeon]